MFCEGERTDTLQTDLPRCSVSYSEGLYLELFNVNKSFVAGRHGAFNNTATTGNTTVIWDTMAYPVVNRSLAGLYICRTDTANSTNMHQLDVFGKSIWYIY